MIQGYFFAPIFSASASWLTPRVWFAKPHKLAQNKIRPFFADIWISLTFSVNQHDQRNEFQSNLFRIQCMQKRKYST